MVSSSVRWLFSSSFACDAEVGFVVIIDTVCETVFVSDSGTDSCETSVSETSVSDGGTTDVDALDSNVDSIDVDGISVIV